MGNYDKQFDNLDPHKVLSTLLKLLGNSQNCEYTYTLEKRDKEKATAPTVTNKNNHLNYKVNQGGSQNEKIDKKTNFDCK